MSDHWEFTIKRPNGTVSTYGAKSKGLGTDPVDAARHVAGMAPFHGCTVTAKFLGTSESHVSVGFSQDGGKSKMRMVHNNNPNRMFFNSAGQQVNQNHEVITPSDKGVEVEGTLAAIAAAAQRNQPIAGVVAVVLDDKLDLATATVDPDGNVIEGEVTADPTTNVQAPVATVGPDGNVVAEPVVKSEPEAK